MPAPRIPRSLARRKSKPDVRRRVQHLVFVRQLPCVACGKAPPSEAAHVRTGTDGGAGSNRAIATPFLCAPPAIPNSIGSVS